MLKSIIYVCSWQIFPFKMWTIDMRDSSLPSCNRKVSSAYWPIAYSSHMVISLKSLLLSMTFANGSSTNMNRYGDNGPLCRHPLVTLKKVEKKPLFITQLCTSLYITSNHNMYSGPIFLYIYIQLNQKPFQNQWKRAIQLFVSIWCRPSRHITI